jgi:methyl-accepting chemotaxis protein
MNEQAESHHIFSEARMKEFGDTSFLGSIKLSARVTIFVIIGALAMAAAAGGYFFVDKKNNQAEENVSNASRTLKLVSTIEQKILQVREKEKSLLKNRAADNLAGFEASVSSITALLDSLYARSDARPAGELIATISEGLGQYIDAINTVVNASLILNPVSEKGKGLEARLINSAVAVETRINASRSDVLINAMADMRKAENDFAISGSARDLVRVKKGFSGFTGLIGTAALAKNKKPPIVALMKNYQAMFAAYAKIRLKQKEGKARIDEIFTYLSPSVEKLSAFANDALAAAERTKSDSGRLSRIGVPVVFLGLLLLLTFTGLVLMQSMAAPVRTLAATAAAMVEGRDVEAAAVLGNSDEIGDLARALANLKASLARTDLLRRDLKIKSAEIEKSAPDPEELARLKQQLAAAEGDNAEWSGQAQAAEREIGVLKTEIETLQTEVEKGEAAVIEAALLRMDLDTTKAELERQSDALTRAETAAGPEAGEPEVAAETVEALPGTISSISRQVARSSETVSAAARDAERTGVMIEELAGAGAKIAEVGGLLRRINKQTDLLVIPPVRDGEKDKDDTMDNNLVAFSSGPRGVKNDGEDEAPSNIERRFEIIRSAANQATWMIRDIGETISRAEEVAAEIAEAASAEALQVTAELLEQSEHLRGMLDALIDKIQASPAEADGGGEDKRSPEAPGIDDNSA